jgi:hypothetical protein
MEAWIDYGAGFTQYLDVDDTAGTECGVGGERSLGVDDYFVKTVVLVQGRVGDHPAVPFSAAGRYPLRVVFRARPERDGADGVVLGESSTITFEVVDPDADGQAVVQQLRTQPWILRGGVDNPGYHSLVRQFPDNPYLHWGKWVVALEKDARIHNGRYPDTDEKYAEIGQGHPLTSQLYRQLADELRDGRTWGQFDEERLQLAAENLERARDLDEAKDVWREIVERFPGSEAAEQAKSRIDTTPPSLQLTTSPATLWPPNNKLVAVTVAAEASDDTDPRPAVKLVSVTCDDACSLEKDVVGAALDTDDRTFQLRATRMGPGGGRTYTITYGATDAAGNRATKAAAVRVPHDQGR